MTRHLPLRANLEQLKKQARALQKSHKAGVPESVALIRQHHPRFRGLTDEQIASTRLTLAEAQHTIANEYGYASWAKLKAGVAALRPAPSTAETVEALCGAAGRGDVARIGELLDAHPELIDEPGGEGVRTALHQAVFGKSEAAAKLLLDRGANPNIRCEGDNAYPLHFAVEKHLFPIIRLLVEHGADTIGEGDYHELGVLGWATAWEYLEPKPEITDYLLAHGARHNIFSAVATGDTEAIRELVRRMPGDLERRMNGTTMRRMPLHLAVMKKQMGSLVTLLDLGARTESLDEGRLTALDQAALLGETDMARELLGRGAKVRLPAAIALGRRRDVERLLARDPGALKHGGRWATLIVRAAECSNGAIIEELIDAGADVNIHDEPGTAIDSTSGYTPLHSAAWHGNLGAIDVLMRRGANVRARETKWHGTPAGWADYAGRSEARDRILRGPIDMIEAVQYGLTERIAAILDEEPGSLNKTFGDYGLFPLGTEAWYTPLAFAVTRGHREIVRLLVDCGADTAVRSPGGETLEEIAREKAHNEIVEILSATRHPAG